MPDEAKRQHLPAEDKKEQVVMTTTADGEKEDQDMHAFWHSSSHLLAHAVKRLFPETKLAIGPAIENGFYYDFDREGGFTTEDLPVIEEEMKKIAKANYRIERFTLPRDEAIEYVKQQDEPYKLEMVLALPEDEEISFYKQEDFTDLCAGPHVRYTKQIKAFKLLSVSGAYWHGDEKNKMLTRIYGVSYPKKEQLDRYLKQLEEAKLRDHRKLGRELELFMTSEAGPGFPFFLPKGMVLRELLVDYWKELHREAGYVLVSTPMILSRSLWEESGHWDHYKDNMYTVVIDEQDYAVKPMNCPGGMLIYKNKPHSYRDLPLRMGELGLVHRHEKSGTLHGLMRVRAFTQDDAHIFMTPDQIEDEVSGIIRLIDRIYSAFGFKYRVELSTRPENSMGDIEDWNRAESVLQKVLEDMGADYRINPGDGAFYGPKIDFHIEDAIGRGWQCGTIQLDFQMPQRFDLEYTGSDGAKHRPIVVHRTALGALERFIAILIEHYSGKFPFWLSPEQVRVLSISQQNSAYAEEVFKRLRLEGFRAELDVRDEKIGYKIREAQLAKIPYMLVVGDREAEEKTLSVRSRDEGNIGSLGIDAFIVKAHELNTTRYDAAAVDTEDE
ncbi:MAG TPA: threonine--tRNA ligase [Clostridiaceae bacterium]|nr:threonine--tRNA ligase [Clostridiaceae bacterium]